MNLLTRRPDEWKDTITCEITDMNYTVTKVVNGNLSKKSKDAEDVIPEANVIIFCIHVHTQREVLARIGPPIDKSKNKVFVGTIYGQAGFNWMVHENKLINGSPYKEVKVVGSLLEVHMPIYGSPYISK